jgi:lipid II:glycine glycyltransferase (peptidoglycan interpeptide bridge formation enzyme)
MRNSAQGSLGIGVGMSSAAGRAKQLAYETEEIVQNANQIDPLLDSRWAALVNKHPAASVFHSLNWLRTLKKVYGYQPVVITTSSAGENLANGLVFCRINSWFTGRRLVSLPFSDHCESLVDNSDELDVLIKHAKQIIRDEKARYFEIRPLYCRPGISSELNCSAKYCFHSLNLQPTVEKLFEEFHKDCVQRKIRRAEREKLRYEEGSSEELLQDFYRLLVMTRRRQYLPPQPLAWFRGLIAEFGMDLKIRVASKDGVALASILTLSHKKTMVYKYGCSNAAFNNLGGTALLFWRAIQEAKDRGFDELEMGRSDVDNLGLVAFKDRWGASRRSIHYWTYPQRASSRSSVWKNNIRKRLVSAAPDLALEAIGGLLYRHIG